MRSDPVSARRCDRFDRVTSESNIQRHYALFTLGHIGKTLATQSCRQWHPKAAMLSTNSWGGSLNSHSAAR